ncbi:MAG: chemotaxis protein CheA [Betaproteobacteria bacterium HGW-Betaproteobacteria-8]|nr:MAG: chemotaxis protein CheA [Betaproteobacteria bacterium HGW-Betaproteobacteria-8]
MTVDMSQFYEVFFDEAEELLAEAERLLLAIDVANPDNEDLNAIFRAAHSIKGGAATFGFMDMTEITHVLENLLDKIRKHEMALTVEHVDAFLAAKDVLEMELDGHRHGSDVDQAQVAEVKAVLASLTQAGAAPVVSAAPAEAEAPSAAAPITPAETGQASVQAAPQAAGLPPPAEGLTQFNILLPELKEKDVTNLQEELGLLGDVAASKHESGRTLLTLNTDSSESDIVSICSFILDPDDLVITQAGVDAAPPVVAAAISTENAAEKTDGADNTEAGSKVKVQEESGYGLFAEEGKEAVEEGYGFFAPFTPHADAPQPLKIDDNTAPMSQEAIAQAVANPAENVAAANKTAATTENGEKRNPARHDTEKAPASTETTSIRVGVEKVDQLINLVGELVITQAMIEQRIAALDPVHHEALVNSVGQLTRNTRDLQESVMSIRMMPMDFVFSRFPRMVRDLASKLGKKVDLVTVGAATELDKGLIERIVDPLTHLVRNSVDHGVETPDKRKVANKPEAGKLTLSAAHKGGSIVIEVTDDGAGLNRDKLLAKAKSNGLNVSENMSDSEVYQLIFAPGFSTAEVVTDVSGRGVGMDVVKRNIAAMNGSIEIRSALGYGTTIAISLPLTLAILDGMSVSLGSSVYVIPLNLIVETLQPRAEDMKTVTGEGRMVHVRGEYLPVIALHTLFNQETEVTDPTQGVLVLIEAEGKKAALFVDALVGQQQVVIKSLETNFRKIRGVSGATIMGDGSVALILDVPALIQLGQAHNYITGAASFSNKAIQTTSKEYTQ